MPFGGGGVINPGREGRIMTRPDTEERRAARSDWFQHWYVTLTNLTTGWSFTSLFLPDSLEETLEVLYDRLKVPGMSHQPQQYSGTGNLKFEFECYYRIGKYDTDMTDLQESRKKLMAMCYSPSPADAVVTAAPPRVLFVWPGLVSLTCIITNLQFKHFRFSPEGFSIGYTVRITLEEVRDIRVLAEDVLLLGTQRGGAQRASEIYPETLQGEGWWGDLTPVETPEEEPTE